MQSQIRTGVSGFDPKVWGQPIWDLLFDMCLALLDPRHADDAHLAQQLRTLSIAMLCLTRTLPCEPCRRNFTYAVQAYALPRLESLHASVLPPDSASASASASAPPPSPPPAYAADATDSHHHQQQQQQRMRMRQDAFVAAVGLLRELQFDVIVRLSGQRGERMVPVPSSDHAKIRELMLMQRSVSSSSRIVDAVAMMAAQIRYEISEPGAWVRFASLHTFLRCAAELLQLVPGRFDLFKAFDLGLRVFADNESSCLTYSTARDRLGLCAKTLAFFIRANLVCFDDVHVSDENGTMYFTSIESLRGSAQGALSDEVFVEDGDDDRDLDGGGRYDGDVRQSTLASPGFRSSAHRA